MDVTALSRRVSTTVHLAHKYYFSHFETKLLSYDQTTLHFHEEWQRKLIYFAQSLSGKKMRQPAHSH